MAARRARRNPAGQLPCPHGKCPVSEHVGPEPDGVARGGGGDPELSIVLPCLDEAETLPDWEKGSL